MTGEDWMREQAVELRASADIFERQIARYAGHDDEISRACVKRLEDLVTEYRERADRHDRRADAGDKRRSGTATAEDLRVLGIVKLPA